MEFRWNAWNWEHATKHGVSVEEAERVVERAAPPSTVKRSATGAAAADHMARTTKKSSPIDAFEALPDEEKKRQVAEFDQEFVAETFRPLTAARRRAWDRVKRKDTAGSGLQKSRSILIPVDVKLLGKADDYAKAHGLTRAEVVELGLQALVTESPRPKRRTAKA